MNRRLITRRELTLGFTASAAGCTPSLSAPEQPRSAAPAAATTPSVPAQRSLDELLAYNRTRDPEYDGSLSNHLSMALGALAKLGATDARLTAFAERYETEPLRARSPLASPDFRASLGTRAAFVALAEQFEAACRERGRHALLGEVLPEVLPGLAGGAFHGLIRSAYALDAEDDAELAHGLAYFVTVAAPFPALPAPRADASTGARELADRALADPRLDKGTFGAVITPALRAAASQPGFDDYMAALRTGPETLDELAHLALDLYVRTFEFTALHAVTSTHALRVLLPYVPEPELALRRHFQALLAASLTLPGRSEPPPLRDPLPDWPELVARARESQDEHDCKFVFTCREEASLRLPDAYRRAATLRLHLS